MTVAVPMTVPGVPMHSATVDVDVAAGLPLMSTVVLPDVMWAIWVGGSMNGSAGCRPTCGGVHLAIEPIVAAGFELMSTLADTAWVTGPAKGIGTGTGLPTGPGTMWAGHMPVTGS